MDLKAFSRAAVIGAGITAVVCGLFLFSPLPGAATGRSSQPVAPIRAEGNGERLENELIYEVPKDQADVLWQFLRKTFSGGFELNGRKYTTSEAIEFFQDQYFDSPSRDLLRAWGGLRLRTRLMEDGSWKRLVQFKQSPEYGGGHQVQTRSEVKFLPLDEERAAMNRERHELLKYLEPQDLSRLRELTLLSGVSPEDLEPFLRITQERKRIYFAENGLRFFTVTLDHSRGGYFWLRSDSWSYDLEIGENAFTAASPDKRREYEAFQQAIGSVIQGAFPGFKQDQEPKVVKLHRLMTSRGPIARMFLNLGMERTVFFSLFCAMAFILLLGLARRVRGIRPASVWGGI